MAETPQVVLDAMAITDADPVLNAVKMLVVCGVEELDDNDPRAIQMLDEMRAVWDNAPVNVALDGVDGRLTGFVVPLDASPDGIREFLLVPYFGACIHTPPPPANQIVRVIAHETVKGLHAMDTVHVRGTLRAARYASADMGVSGYEIRSAAVEPFVAKAQ